MFKQLLLLLFFIMPASAEEINWLMSAVYPFRISEGRFIGQGVVDQFEQQALKQLKQHTFNLQSTNLLRLKVLMKSGIDFCTSDLLQTEERSKYLVYSEPINPMLPNGVLIRSGDERFKPFIDEEGTINLSAVLNDSSLIIGLVKGRSYSGVIDSTLVQHTSHKESWYMVGQSANRLMLLAKKRIDYTIAYPDELYFLAKEQGSHINLQYVPVTGMEKLLFTRVSCTANPLGELIIKDFNNLFRKQGSTFYINHYLKWLPADSHNYYMSLVNNLD